jgi:gamma-glutamyltranspeptidase/glutathione hydrolase
MTGIGGDLFALVWDANTQHLYGLDASGRAPFAATPAEFAGRGLHEMPASGVLAVNVPGAVDGWDQLHSQFGTMPLRTLLQPAIGYARDGFPVQEIIAADWHNSTAKLARDDAAARTFLPRGRAPHAGETFANPPLAQSLTSIAEGGRDAFYNGPIARAICADLSARHGLLTERDFAEHKADWVEPIATSYRGVHLHEMPPSTQGFVALQMLNLLEGYDVAAMGHGSADHLHAVVEAKKIAFADRGVHLADRDYMAPGMLEKLISKEYAASRRQEIALTGTGGYSAGRRSIARAAVDFHGRDLGDTVFLTAADRHGNVVALIQSLFASFGAGIVAGDTGIALHNRGSGFTLAPGHPNQIGPHKRPLHTLVPALIVRDGRPWVSFGVMGGDNQAQAHAQIVMNLVDFGMHIQDAGEAARIRHGGDDLYVESAIGEDVRSELRARGHNVVDGRGMMGGFQGIMIDRETGVLMGGSDARKDGCAIGW